MEGFQVYGKVSAALLQQLGCLVHHQEVDLLDVECVGASKVVSQTAWRGAFRESSSAWATMPGGCQEKAEDAIGILRELLPGWRGCS